METQSFDEIAEVVKNHLAIDTDNLDTEALNNHKVYVALSKLHIQHTKILRDVMKQLKKVELLQTRHYTGKMSGEHYQKNPLPEIVLKTDVDKYLAIDPMVSEMRDRVAQQDEIVNFLEESIKLAKYRVSSDIRAAIEWRKFITNGS